MKRLILITFAVLCLSVSSPSANVLEISKTPYEVFLVSVDFADPLGSDSITFDSVTSTDRATKQISTTQVIASSPIPAIVPSTKKVAFAIKGGASGQTHLISVKVIDTTTGEKFEGQITLIVN